MLCKDSHCSLLQIVAELRHAAPDNKKEQERLFWEKLLESSEQTGDTIGDYDGPLTWA